MGEIKRKGEREINKHLPVVSIGKPYWGNTRNIRGRERERERK